MNLIAKSYQNDETAVCLRWVKSHIGIGGDEAADEEAKKAAEGQNLPSRAGGARAEGREREGREREGREQHGVKPDAGVRGTEGRNLRCRGTEADKKSIRI